MSPMGRGGGGKRDGIGGGGGGREMKGGGGGERGEVKKVPKRKSTHYCTTNSH